MAVATGRAFSSYIKTSFSFFTRKNYNVRVVTIDIPVADMLIADM